MKKGKGSRKKGKDPEAPVGGALKMLAGKTHKGQRSVSALGTGNSCIKSGGKEYEHGNKKGSSSLRDSQNCENRQTRGLSASASSESDLKKKESGPAVGKRR